MKATAQDLKTIIEFTTKTFGNAEFIKVRIAKNLSEDYKTSYNHSTKVTTISIKDQELDIDAMELVPTYYTCASEEIKKIYTNSFNNIIKAAIPDEFRHDTKDFIAHVRKNIK